MKWTRANVAEFARERGLESIQIDGIPEGFSWLDKRERDVGGLLDYGTLYAFKPLTEQLSHAPVVLRPTETLEEELPKQIKRLLELYG